MKNQKLIYFLCVALFAGVGIYLTFISSNVSGYDTHVQAYEIDPNERYDSDGSIYSPIYYFKVDDKDYKCESHNDSSIYPDEKKNIVYYDSKDPSKCKTEYDKSTHSLGGILLLVIAIALILFYAIKKPYDKDNIDNQVQEYNNEAPIQIDQEKAEKVVEVVATAQLIYKRIIIGFIIAILLVLILFDTLLLRQTIISKDYPETTATFVKIKEDDESSVFDDCIYKFYDKDGNEQEIIMSVSKDDVPRQELKIKYNEKKPQDYYTEDAIMDTKGIILYVVKSVVAALLIVLFFNKRLLNKISVSAR